MKLCTVYEEKKHFEKDPGVSYLKILIYEKYSVGKCTFFI
jgi:hypothetical protein